MRQFAIVLGVVVAISSAQAHDVVPPLAPDQCHTHVVAAGDEPTRHCHPVQRRKHDSQKALLGVGALTLGLGAAWLLADQLYDLGDEPAALRFLPYHGPNRGTGFLIEQDLAGTHTIGFHYVKPERGTDRGRALLFWRLLF